MSLRSGKFSFLGSEDEFFLPYGCLETAAIARRREVSMLRPIALIALLMLAVQIAASQSVPTEFLSTPVRLALNKPTQEVKAGSSVVYTVTLKDAADRPATATSNLQLEVETPSGTQTVVLLAGQSSANFTWQAQKSGVMQMTVRVRQNYIRQPGWFWWRHHRRRCCPDKARHQRFLLRQNQPSLRK